MNRFSPVWMRACCFRYELREKPRSQPTTGHTNGFSPVWMRSCSLQWPDCVKPSPQNAHTCCRPLLCSLRCALSASASLHDAWQLGHKYAACTADRCAYMSTSLGCCDEHWGHRMARDLRDDMLLRFLRLDAEAEGSSSSSPSSPSSSLPVSMFSSSGSSSLSTPDEGGGGCGGLGSAEADRRVEEGGREVSVLTVMGGCSAPGSGECGSSLTDTSVSASSGGARSAGGTLPSDAMGAAEGSTAASLDAEEGGGEVVVSMSFVRGAGAMGEGVGSAAASAVRCR